MPPSADYARLAELVVAPEVRPADRVRLSRRLEEGRRVEALAEAHRQWDAAWRRGSGDDAT